MSRKSSNRDRRLLFARPQVLSTARVRVNRLSCSPTMTRPYLRSFPPSTAYFAILLERVASNCVSGCDSPLGRFAFCMAFAGLARGNFFIIWRKQADWYSAGGWHAVCEGGFAMAQASGQRANKQTMNTSQARDGWSPGKSKSKPKHAPLPRSELNLAKGHDEELMGRPRMALLYSTRLAMLKHAGSPGGRP